MTTDFIINIVPTAPVNPLDRWNNRQFDNPMEAVQAYRSNRNTSLTAMDERLILDCEAFTCVNTMRFTSMLPGLTTDRDRHILVRAKDGHRFDGTLGSSFTLQSHIGQVLCGEYQNNLRFDGIQFTNTNNQRAITHDCTARPVDGGGLFVKNCIFTECLRAVEVSGDWEDVYMVNCILDECGGLFYAGSVGNADVYIINCHGAPRFYGVTFGGTTSRLRLLNNYLKSSLGAAYDAYIYYASGACSIESNFNGDGHTSAVAGAYAPGSQPGTNECFDNETPAYRPGYFLWPVDEDPAVYRRGINVFNFGGIYEIAGQEDILGNPRVGDEWDIGAYALPYEQDPRLRILSFAVDSRERLVINAEAREESVPVSICRLRYEIMMDAGSLFFRYDYPVVIDGAMTWTHAFDIPDGLDLRGRYVRLLAETDLPTYGTTWYSTWRKIPQLQVFNRVSFQPIMPAIPPTIRPKYPLPERAPERGGRPGISIPKERDYTSKG